MSLKLKMFVAVAFRLRDARSPSRVAATAGGIGGSREGRKRRGRRRRYYVNTNFFVDLEEGRLEAL